MFIEFFFENILFFCFFNMFRVIPQKFSEPNINPRGKVHGFSEKILDFPRFWSKVTFFPVRLHITIDRNKVISAQTVWAENLGWHAAGGPFF